MTHLTALPVTIRETITRRGLLVAEHDEHTDTEHLRDLLRSYTPGKAIPPGVHSIKIHHDRTTHTVKEELTVHRGTDVGFNEDVTELAITEPDVLLDLPGNLSVILHQGQPRLIVTLPGQVLTVTLDSQGETAFATQLLGRPQSPLDEALALLRQYHLSRAMAPLVQLEQLIDQPTAEIIEFLITGTTDRASTAGRALL